MRITLQTFQQQYQQHPTIPDDYLFWVNKNKELVLKPPKNGVPTKGFKEYHVSMVDSSPVDRHRVKELKAKNKFLKNLNQSDLKNDILQEILDIAGPEGGLTVGQYRLIHTRLQQPKNYRNEFNAPPFSEIPIEDRIWYRGLVSAKTALKLHQAGLKGPDQIRAWRDSRMARFPEYILPTFLAGFSPRDVQKYIGNEDDACYLKKLIRLGMSSESIRKHLDAGLRWSDIYTARRVGYTDEDIDKCLKSGMETWISYYASYRMTPDQAIELHGYGIYNLGNSYSKLDIHQDYDTLIACARLGIKNQDVFYLADLDFSLEDIRKCRENGMSTDEICKEAVRQYQVKKLQNM